MIESRIGPLDLDAAVQGNLRHGRALRDGGEGDAHDPDDADAAARDAVEDAIRDAPARTAWELVQTLLEQAPDDELGFYAAGPLENLVHLRGEELIGEIEARAEADPRFRWALGCVWLSHGELSAPVLERVVRASGGRIEPLPPLTEPE